MTAPLLAAAAEVCITPPVGATLLGFLGPATGVHDDLLSRMLMLSDGKTAAVVVSLDLVGMDFSLADEMREAIRVATGADLVLLACSHTHSAPFTIPWSLKGRRWLDGPEGLAWREGIIHRAAETAAGARERLRPAALRAGRAEVQVGHNRRAVTAEGVTMQPNPEGVTVPWVDVLCVEHEDGGSPVVLFSHAAHPVIVHAASSLVSADYPGYAVAAVERRLGEGTMAMFAQACGGNINGHPLRGGFEAAKPAGEELAEAVLRAVATAQPLPAAPLRTATVATRLPLHPLPPVEACRELVRRAEEQAAGVEAEGADDEASWFMQDDVLCSRDLLAQATAGGPGAIRFEASILAVGDTWGLVALTHEVFAEYQRRLDHESPWAHTMVTAYTNGCESYIPTDAALGEGGYEAASYPDMGAAWRYPYRVAMAPGGEGLVMAAVQDAMRAVRQA